MTTDKCFFIVPILSRSSVVWGKGILVTATHGSSWNAQSVNADKKGLESGLSESSKGNPLQVALNCIHTH